MPSLVALAEQLLAQARQLEQTLEQNDIPHTSFDRDTLDLLPSEFQKLRWDVLDTSHTIRQLAHGSRRCGLNIAFNWLDQLVLRIILHYKLASAVPVDGSATYDEISAASGLARPLVSRVIRAAILLNIFDRQGPDRIRHTALSRLLAENVEFEALACLQIFDLGPASLHLIEAWDKFGHDAGEPEKSAFGLANGGRSLFDVLAQEPERAERFHLAMKHSVQTKDFNFDEIVNAYDWSHLDQPGSRLVDLGGGFGQICQILAKHTKNLVFTIQDLPNVAESGRERLPQEFRGRISFEAHDFLEPQQTEKPPEAYIISRCLHNWSDQRSAQILRCLIPGLGKDSKVFIWDSVIEDEPSKKWSERWNLQQDLLMATISNGTDRTAGEFNRVLEMSDERFVVDSIRKPRGSKLSLIEISWKG